MKTIIIDGVEYNLTPKVAFREGDWVVNTITHQVEQIIGITNNAYICSECPIVSFENQHLLKKWTIQDAKEGDLIYVSTEEKGIQAIFHEYKNGTIFLHCYLCCDFVQDGYMPIGDVELVYPLQKTHYKRFFEKMHEAGYEWDEEKKELKKIKDEPDKCEGCNNAKGCVACVDGSEWAHIEEKSFWSEEDEKMFNSTLWHIKNSCGNGGKNSGEFEVYNWLKSLKERYTWKPSEKQMKTLEYYMHVLVCNHHKEILFSLYQDLKELRDG